MKNSELKKITGFEWDAGNIDKNWHKHQVTWSESEEVFFNSPIIITDDKAHSSESENRFYALGKTNENRRLFLVFTLRNDKIRIISARSMNIRERKLYNEEERKNIKKSHS